MTSVSKGSCAAYSDADQSPASGTPASIRDARAFGELDGQVVLVAADGHITARLTPAAGRLRDPNTISDTVPIPTLSTPRASVLDGPTVVPTGLAPATRENLLGTWAPEPTGDPRRGNGSLKFTPDQWFASDGCNGVGGSWAVDRNGGAFLAASTGSGLVACSPADGRGPAVAGATYAGLDGSTLVFTDATGALIGRFLKQAATPVAS